MVMYMGPLIFVVTSHVFSWNKQLCIATVSTLSICRQSWRSNIVLLCDGRYVSIQTEKVLFCFHKVDYKISLFATQQWCNKNIRKCHHLLFTETQPFRAYSNSTPKKCANFASSGILGRNAIIRFLLKYQMTRHLFKSISGFPYSSMKF